MAATPSGSRYWVVSQTGAVYSYGDGVSTGSPGLAPFETITVLTSPDRQGYWLFSTTGRAFAYSTAEHLAT